MKIVYIAFLLVVLVLQACSDSSLSDNFENLSEPKVSTSTADLKSIANQSDYICRATIISIKTSRQQFDPQVNMVMSDITIKTVKTYKGNFGEVVTIRAFGGILDGVDYTPPDMPTFHEGEDVILFLRNFNQGIFTVNHSEGKLTIIDNKTLKTGQGVDEFETLIVSILLKP